MGLASDIAADVSNVLSASWTIRDGRVVPESDDVGMAGDAVRLEASFLFSDLRASSKLATEFQQRTAAKVNKAFLKIASRIIRARDGHVRSFDGDRVMGIFIGDSKCSNAGEAALNIHWAVKMLKLRVWAHFVSLKTKGFGIGHCSGIDVSTVLCVRAGMRGSNDLIWVGRAPNWAAKLSDIRNYPYNSYATSEAYAQFRKGVRFASDGSPMWEKRNSKVGNIDPPIYRSRWLRKP